MSPEQVAGGPVDGRSDLYSLGCVLYEMLTGSPPFSGPNPQAVAALHARQQPAPLESVMASVPASIADAVETALAKNPDDRFRTPAAFAEALVDTRPRGSRTQPRTLWRRLVAGGAAAMLLAAPLAFRRGHVVLDPSRVVVYPISTLTAEPGSLAPDEVTLALVASLNSTASLVGIDGGRLGSPADGLNDGTNDRVAREQRAGYYVSAQLLAPDSLHLVLDLHDLRAGTVTQRTLDFAPGTNSWAIGVRAALEVLPVLIPTGGRQDLPSLQGRSPRALAAYFRGEQAYRSAAFGEALKHFRTAVGVDSSFALAALRGAMVASWSERPDEALLMARAAVSREGSLPDRLNNLAHGLVNLMAGAADSAVARFRQTLRLDPENVEAWMGLAETFHHLLPREVQLDSLAEDAFLRVRVLDPEFAPAMFHLIEYAVRRGDIAESRRLLARFAAARPDSVSLSAVQLTLDCVGGTMTPPDWQAAVLRDPVQTLAAGQLLAVGGLRQPGCAEAAFRAVLAFDTTGSRLRARTQFGALVGLQNVLVARGQDDAARKLLESDTLFSPTFRGELHLLNAMAGRPFAKEAEAFGQELMAKFRREPSAVSNMDLWFLGSWEAAQGRARTAAEIADSITARGVNSGARRDSLFVATLKARVALAEGDSAAALTQLRALSPTADDWNALAWNPWEALGGERLLLARLLLARGEALAALQVASVFDAPSPMTYLPYLPASIAVRIAAAERLGDGKLAQRLRRRLAELEKYPS
jgi:serine/threonine-protein kinase